MNKRLELRHLHYFLAVAEVLHFGKAALRLRVAQPALSQQIRQLEEIMGVTLFTRTSRVVELTEAGRSFQSRARELVVRLSADIDDARRIARGESGRIDLAFVSSAAGMLSALIRRFALERPGITVTMHEGFTADVLSQLQRGTVDIGAVRDGEAREGLTLTPIFEEPYVAVLPATHPLAAARHVSAVQLVGTPLVLFPQAAGLYAYERNLQPFREAGVEPMVSFYGAQWSSIMQMVANDLGVTVAPASAASPLPAGAVAVPLVGTRATSTIQLAQRTDDRNGLVAAFKDMAVGV